MSKKPKRRKVTLKECAEAVRALSIVMLEIADILEGKMEPRRGK